MLLPILLLSAAGFTILTTEFLIVGLLPGLARDLDVTVSQAGLLVTLFAFTVAATGPLLTALMANIERKRLFIGVLILFGLSNALAMAAPNIWVMAVARFVPALALPVFWSLASATAVELVGPARAGRAISLVAFGIVAATVFGIPIGVLISDAFGWRAAFGVLSAVAFAKALLLWIAFPSTRIQSEDVKLVTQLRILRKPIVVGHVLLSLLVFTGMFTAYTYLADMLERLAGFNGQIVGWTMMAFGAVGLIGNTVGGRAGGPQPARRHRAVLGADGRRPGHAGASHPLAWPAGRRAGGLGHRPGRAVHRLPRAPDEVRARGAGLRGIAQHLRRQYRHRVGRGGRRTRDRHLRSGCAGRGRGDHRRGLGRAGHRADGSLARRPARPCRRGCHGDHGQARLPERGQLSRSRLPRATPPRRDARECSGLSRLPLQWSSWGRSGFDVGRETTQGMPSTSKLVKPLEHYKRQRRAFRSRRLSGEPLH